MLLLLPSWKEGEEEGEKVGDGRAEESSAIGDRGEAAISLMHDIDDTLSAPLLEPDACSHPLAAQVQYPASTC